MNTLNNTERNLIVDVINTMTQLPLEEQEKLVYIGQGMLLAVNVNEEIRRAKQC